MTPPPAARAVPARALALTLALTLLAAAPAQAQDISISLGEGGSLSGRAIQLIALITVLSLAPGLAIMAARLDATTFEAMAALRPDASSIQTGPDAPLSVLVPSFMLSEIARAFQIGFLIFLPFLIIDLVIAAVLMSMGMMMVPPALVSLPFKLAFFVIADGWSLIAASLVRGYM